MNILLLGSGGREHALAWKMIQSPKTKRLFIAPGNAGTSLIGTNIPLDTTDFEAIKHFVVENEVDMVVVGPEIPLVKGIRNYFLNDEVLQTVQVIGPSKEAAMLEGSKSFAKEFMHKYEIPTAAYQRFDASNLEDGYRFLETLQPPYVLKADGLAAGKGVLILDDLQKAKEELTEMINGAKFGEASTTVVIEEFLQGIELSAFALVDGKSFKVLPVAKDYKRVGEADTGLNTGGMGSVSPVPFASDELLSKIKERIIKPTVDGMQLEKLAYTGFLFFGLMIVNGEPFVIEYNCRMGDPEAESIIPRIKTDLVELFEAVGNTTLGTVNLEIDDRYAASVMLVSGGYPESYGKGKTVTGILNVNNCILFHAGTSRNIDDESLQTSGGRVLAVTAYGNTMDEALQTAYANVKIIDFEGKYYRRDIGFDLKKNLP